VLWLGVALVGSGCGLVPAEDTKRADGERCSTNDECRSGTCTTNELCAHNSCDCPGDSCPANGAHSADCGSKWVCLTSTSIVEDVGQFFSGDTDNDGYCELPCSEGCPEHYFCGGQYCVPDQGWVSPVPTISWSGAQEGMETGKGASTTLRVEPGKTVALEASAESPTGVAIAAFAWNLVDSSGLQTQTSGASLDVTLAPADGFRRAELTVTDAKQRAALSYVIVEACLGAGMDCGFQGSGCCTSCDDATNICN
jgi:hypothetical protein